MRCMRWIPCCFLAAMLAACAPRTRPLPTVAVAAPTLQSPATPTVSGPLPPTWTPLADPAQDGSDMTPRPSWTPPPSRVTNTPWPTLTATATPVALPSPSPEMEATATFTVVPTVDPPAPLASPNLLPNPSFENGWYNLGGIPELQVPHGWILEWDEGANPLDADPWNAFVRPESRVLSPAFLPASEHDIFIWDGSHTVKIFKGAGAISFRLLADVSLEPGAYLLEIFIFPDLVDDYSADGDKIWAPDPLSGEVRLIVDQGGSSWFYPSFGIKNRFSLPFTVSEARVYRVGLAVRGRWAIENNGWFMDDWSLQRVAESSSG